MASSFLDGGSVPGLVRLLTINLALGGAVGTALASAAVLADFAGLKTLMMGDQAPYLALFLLIAFMSFTSAGVLTGIAIMRLPNGEPAAKSDDDEI